MEKEQLYQKIIEKKAILALEKKRAENEFLDNVKIFEKIDFWKVYALEDADVDEILLAALKIEDSNAYEIAKEGLYKDNNKFFASISGKQAKLYFTKLAEFFKAYQEGDFDKAKVELVEGESAKSKLYFPVETDEQELLLSTHSYEEVLNNFSGLFSLAIKADFFNLISVQYVCELHLFQEFLNRMEASYKEKYKVDDLSSLPAGVFHKLSVDHEKRYRQYLDKHNLEYLTQELINVYKNYKSQYEKYITSVERKMKKYSTLTKRIDKALSTSREIADYRDLVSGVDEDIKISILNLVDEHNKQCYSSTLREYNIISADDKLKYLELLSSYGIIVRDDCLEDICKHSLEEVENLLKKFDDLGIKDALVLLETLKKGSCETVDKISKYIKRGIIKVDFVKSNPEIFNSASDLYNNVLANIDSIISKNITPTFIMENQEVLLIPNEILRSNIDTVCEYGLKNSLTASVGYGMLEEADLATKLDVIIEMGYDNVLKSNLSIASYSKEEWKKIQVLRMMNFEVSDEELENILRSKTFVVGENEIDNYIFKALDDKDNNMINEMSENLVSVANPLEEYAVSDLSYNIGGVIVSRNKVKRNLGKLQNIDMNFEEKLLLCVLNNMSISSDEVISIKQMLGVGVEK